MARSPAVHQAVYKVKSSSHVPGVGGPAPVIRLSLQLADSVRPSLFCPLKTENCCKTALFLRRRTVENSYGACASQVWQLAGQGWRGFEVLAVDNPGYPLPGEPFCRCLRRRNGMESPFDAVSAGAGTRRGKAVIGRVRGGVLG
jgi:hypothetical protein